MTSIFTDLVADHRLSVDADGYTVERSYLVDDITGSPDARLYNATIQSGIPQYGEAHPSIPDITVTNVIAEPVNNQSAQVKVTVVYSIPDAEDAEPDADNPGTVLVSSSLTNETTHFDINGELIKASYSTALGVIQTTYAAIDVQRPQMRVTLSRKESVIPKDNIIRHLGRINSVAWSGFPAQTWLCSGISVREDGDNANFDIDYSFEYREERWKGELVLPLNASDAQEFPIDTDTGNGFARFDVYETSNFNELGVSF